MTGIYSQSFDNKNDGTIQMNYKITLKYGAFFFAGKIGVAGNGNTIKVEESELDPYTIKAINSAQMNGIIDTDIPILLEDTFQTDISIESEVTEEVVEVIEEKVEEVEATESETVLTATETDRKVGKKNKRG